MPDLSQEFTTLPVDALEPHPDNPRRGDVDAIAESIEHNGFYGAIIAQRRDDGTLRIIAGEHRWRGAQKQGMDEVPVMVLDVADDVALRIMLADNRTTDLASYDDEMLTGLLSGLDDNLDGTGYSAVDLTKLILGAGDDLPPSSQAPFSTDEVIDAATEFWIKEGFPYPKRLPIYESMRAVNALAAAETSDLPTTKLGYAVADGYQQRRWDVPVNGAIAAPTQFSDPERLRLILAAMLEDDSVLSSASFTPATIRGVASFFRGAQSASNFRPGFALYVYRKWGVPGGRLLDTSAGFGGRLIGFLASELTHYTGIDPAEETQAANRQIASDLSNGDKTVDLIVQPAEEVDPAGQEATFDLAFTSPPYFSKELYSDEPTQSHVRYGDSLDAWIDGFLAPTLRLQFQLLRPGAASVVNIADIKLGSTIYPLVEATVSSAKAAGFVHEETQFYGLARVPGKGRRSDGEPLLIFRKPTPG